MPEEQHGRRDAPRGSPVAGDAACVWHALDFALQRLYEARDGFAGAGCEDLAEQLQDVMDEAEAVRGKAEAVVMKSLESSN